MKLSSDVSSDVHPAMRIVCFLVCVVCSSAGLNAGDAPLRFASSHHGDPGATAPVIAPWKRVVLDPVYGGHWVVTGDVDGDGAVDVVSARNVNSRDVHYTSTAVAQCLDGSVIWRWGDPAVGRRKWHHDVACQIYDWNGDGANEVILLTKGFLVELDGSTGTERRRFAIPPEATDCLVFANLSGAARATDVLVKTRYTQIWAYSYAGKLLWTVKHPGGSRTAHQPRPMDLTGDGRDEVLAGYAMLNPDGTLRWKYASHVVDQERGHLDCARILRKGTALEQWRLVLTCCGAEAIACVDGNGMVKWEVAGHHFESVQVGTVFPDLPGPQILVDIDHRPRGESPLWVLDADGTHRGTIMADYCRHHDLLDWTGDGCDEMLIADGRGVFDRHGRRIATFGTGARGISLLLGDMTGDGVSDVTMLTETPLAVHVFKNEKGRRPKGTVPLGCGVNFTLY